MKGRTTQVDWAATAKAHGVEPENYDAAFRARHARFIDREEQKEKLMIVATLGRPVEDSGKLTYQRSLYRRTAREIPGPQRAKAFVLDLLHEDFLRGSRSFLSPRTPDCGLFKVYTCLLDLYQYNDGAVMSSHVLRSKAELCEEIRKLDSEGPCYTRYIYVQTAKSEKYFTNPNREYRLDQAMQSIHHFKQALDDDAIRRLRSEIEREDVPRGPKMASCARWKVQLLTLLAGGAKWKEALSKIGRAHGDAGVRAAQQGLRAYCRQVYRECRIWKKARPKDWSITPGLWVELRFHFGLNLPQDKPAFDEAYKRGKRLWNRTPNNLPR